MGTNYKNIIWDWNGTLLNDITICIKSMNILLKERTLPLISEDKYRDIFTFPVRNYYEQLGFDFTKEEFDGPALKFIEYYHEFLPSVDLFHDVEMVLEEIKKNGLHQYILSAMEQESLLASVQNLKIDKYFNKIIGIDDHFARSKVDRGLHLIENNNFDRAKTLMIGDTLHDMEVAKVLGVDCLLVARGHQSKSRLKINGNNIINDLNDLFGFL
ncbi:MAG: HAD family hydrolase [Salinivirgaceae bacterium]|nr:HAD family hydrolase [Salinivirgaceae bacterium]